MKTRDVVAVVLALAIGAVLGALVGSKDSDHGQEMESVESRHAQIGDLGESATVVSLRAQIAELKNRLRELANADAAKSNGNQRVAVEPDRRPPMNFREQMERMKEENPARYAEMTNRFERFKRMRAERYRNRCEFLKSIDTSKMSEEARKTHDDYQLAIARSEELMEQMHNDDLTDEQRRQLMQEMHENRRELRELEKDERANLFEETAKVLGFEGEDLKTISSTLTEIVESTEGGRGFGPPPRPDGGRGEPPDR